MKFHLFCPCKRSPETRLTIGCRSSDTRQKPYPPLPPLPARLTCIATKPYLRFNQALLAVQVGLFYHPVCKQLKINQLQNRSHPYKDDTRNMNPEARLLYADIRSTTKSSFCLWQKGKVCRKKLTEKQHEKELTHREYLYHPPATRTGISSSGPLQGTAAFS